MNENHKTVLAQIGCGYWGPNLLRNFSSLPNVQVKYLVDPSAERRAFVTKAFPATGVSESIDRLWGDREVQGVIIATPAGTHFELASLALRHGKHAFVEKPLAMSVREVDELARLAAERSLIVMAGHTFIYNNAVKYVKKLIDTQELGEVRYIYGQRLNLGRIRSDVDALWNFAPHDISIIQYWLGDPTPAQITRHGMAYVQPGVDDVVFLTIVYPTKVMANIHVSWLDPHKVRKIVVVGTKKMVVYDDVSDEKVAIYDKGIDRKARLGEDMVFDKPAAFSFDYRAGDIVLPKIQWVEPLRNQAEHFVECLVQGRQPITGIAHARNVVQILERAVRA